MRDITEHLRNAELESKTWGVAGAMLFLTKASYAVPGSVVDYEPDAEGCGRLQVEEETVGFANGRLPFCFICESISTQLQSLCSDLGLGMILYAAWDTESFSVELSLAERVFGSPIPPEMDAARLSAWDIWYWCVRG